MHVPSQVFVDLDFTLLEMNPFCFDAHTGLPGTYLLVFSFCWTLQTSFYEVPLDVHAELDDTAAFKNRKKWVGVEFPPSFGKTSLPEEEFIASLDAQTGASLKLTVLNPHGKIWTMVAGGGAYIWSDFLITC